LDSKTFRKETISKTRIEKTMKLIMAVVQDKDAEGLLYRLTQKGFRATKMASTGGFLRQGNSTVFLGVEDEQVDEVIDLIRDCCKVREHYINPTPFSPAAPGSFIPYPMRVEIGGATIFVIPVDRLEKI